MKKYHYTYVLKRVHDDALYIGVRSSTLPPEDDIAYMSSSKLVKQEIAAGVKYRKKIIAVWPSRKKAVAHEIELHAKYEVAQNNRFLNKVKQTASSFDRAGVPHSTKTRKQIKRYWTDERREDWSERNSGENNPRFGATCSEETKQRMSEGWTTQLRKKVSKRMQGANPTMDPQVAAKVSASLKGRPKSDKHKQAMREAKTPEIRKRMSERYAGSIWITDGKVSKRLSAGCAMPKGFRKGKLPEPKFSHPKHPGKLLMKSHWSRWANENLPESKILNFMKQLLKEN